MKTWLGWWMAVWLLVLTAPAFAQRVVPDGPELYPGEKKLAEAAAGEGLAIAGNTALSWANWGAVVRAFSQRYPDVTLVHNDLGSTAVVSQLDRQRDRPVMDTVYYFGLIAIDAASRGLLAPFKPNGVDKLPPSLRDAEGLWTVVHHMPVAFLVNRKAVRNIPRSWADLLKPEYKNSVVYFDPSTTTVGLITAYAANIAAGGSFETVRPGIEYFAKLHRAGNVLRMDSQSAYPRFLRGEIPIWINFETDGLRARETDGFGDVEIVLPSDGTVAAPYAMSLVKNGPNPNASRLWFNFVMSDPAQRLFAEGFVRPAVPGLALAPALATLLPPPARLEPIDPLRAALRKPDLDRGWPSIIAGTP